MTPAGRIWDMTRSPLERCRPMTDKELQELYHREAWRLAHRTEDSIVEPVTAPRVRDAVI